MLELVTQQETPLVLRGSLLELLVADMLATGKFREDRLRQPGLLENLRLAGRSVILPDFGTEELPEEIYAHVARLKTKNRCWEEIALAFVKNGYERNGYLGQIVRRLLKDAPPDLNFFGITRDLAVMKVFRRHGLRPVTKAIDPNIEEWADNLGISEILPDTTLLGELVTPSQIIEANERFLEENPAVDLPRWLWMEVEHT